MMRLSFVFLLLFPSCAGAQTFAPFYLVNSTPPAGDSDTVKIYSGDYYVRPGGSDGADGTSYANAWQTLTNANSTPGAGDTVVIYAGTYTGNLNPANSGSSGQPIVYSAYGSDVVTITGDGTANDGNSLSLSTDYVNVERIVFQDAARTSTAAAWYWGKISGDYARLKRVKFWDDQDTSVYITGGKHGRLLAISGKYTTIERSRFRGGREGIVIDGTTPRYYNFDRDTVTWTAFNNIILGGGGATEGVFHAGIVQNCVLDTCGEDNIQLQNNGTPSELANSGIIICNNFMANARENCIDVKATGPTVCIENNVLIMSYGDDTNEDNGGVDNDNGGAGIELGAGDYSERVMTRFNLILFNHTGSKLYAGGHFYNNTVGANNHSYRGLSDTTIQFTGLATDGTSEVGYKRILNNIFFQHSHWTTGCEVLLKRAGGSNFHTDYNLYWNYDGLARFGTNITGQETEIFFVGLTDWTDELATSPYDGWTGKDANSVEDDPEFVSVPSPLTAWSPSLDFNIQSGSPAEGAGTALTTATNSGTNSTTLTVDDPYFFRSDYGITSFYPTDGDSIKIGSGTAVQISAINYSTSTLTLSAQRTWSSSDSVWLWKDGIVVNDIGAKQR